MRGELKNLVNGLLPSPQVVYPSVYWWDYSGGVLALKHQLNDCLTALLRSVYIFRSQQVFSMATLSGMTNIRFLLFIPSRRAVLISPEVQ